ncbi:MAG: hypothetical protein KF850_08975 [Labilithrix sp.]|nr:hypothetical protein [Labilithrix sp.]
MDLREEEAKSVVSPSSSTSRCRSSLTTGNHDGYVSTGHVPGAVKNLD